MNRVVIIHGSYGTPAENWFSWLSDELRRDGHEVLAPAFPTPEGQSLNAWRAVFEKEIGSLTAQTVLVGHSLAPGFILHLLQESTAAISGTFLVSGFLGELGLDEFDPINATFVSGPFDWQRIRNNAGTIMVYNSDNDPYVPIAKGQELSKQLGVELHIIKDGGHINTSAGFKEFPQLLADIQSLLQCQDKEL